MQSDLLGAHAMGLRNLLSSPAIRPGRRLPGRDRRVRRRLDRPDQCRGASQPRPRHRRQPIGQPTAFHIGVAVNPGALDWTRRSAASTTRSRRAPSSRSRNRSSMPGVRYVPRRHRGRCPRSSRGSGRSRACATPSSWPTKCRACRCRRRSSNACARPRGGRAQAEGHADCARGGGRDPSARPGIADIHRGRSGHAGPPGDGGGDVLTCIEAVSLAHPCRSGYSRQLLETLTVFDLQAA